MISCGILFPHTAFGKLPPVQASTAPAGRQMLRGHVPEAVSNQKAPMAGRLPAAQRLNLSIGVPMRDRPGLEAFLTDLYDPDSPTYRRFLTVQEFTDRFAPAQAEYQEVVDFARANGLDVIDTPANRLIVSVEGPVSTIERAFQCTMGVYRHPTENRTFHAPSGEPTVPAGIKVLHITGLDDFAPPRHLGLRPNFPFVQFLAPGQAGGTGSGPNGSFIGNDFRAAYAPGVSLTGAGQSVAVVALQPYNPSDIQGYFQQAGLPLNVPIRNVLLDGVSGVCDPNATPPCQDYETAMDIELIIAMAPGLNEVIVYENQNIDGAYNRIATDNSAKQINCSWGFSVNPNQTQILMELAAQGQNLFVGSGDNGAYTTGDMWGGDNSYFVSVGGTSMKTNGPGGAWQSETAWSPHSGGGISQSGVPIPGYQQGIGNSANQASTTLRNYPDVSIQGDQFVAAFIEGVLVHDAGGTSASGPLWAGFLALVNQQAAQNGKPPVGFLNPTIYAIGKSSNYPKCFHDVTIGSNPSTTGSPQVSFNAVTGYDLVTGWGSPAGQPLIDALAGAPADFSIWALQAPVTAARGSNGAAVIMIVPVNGFTGSVALTASGLPSGVTASFSPSSTKGTSTLTLSASSSATIGKSTVTITGKSGTLTRTTTLTLTVTAAPASDFSLSASPGSLTIAQGAGKTSTITVNKKNGFNGTVSLLVSGLPGGAMATFNPTPTTGSSILTIFANAAAPGTSTLGVIGTSGAITHSVPVTLVITAGPAPASPPVTVSPADGATYLPLPVTFVWNAVPGATSYNLQVSTAQNFSSTVINATGISGINYASSGFAYMTKYFWRVSASNAGGTSAWSAVKSFSTGPGPNFWYTLSTCNAGNIYSYSPAAKKTDTYAGQAATVVAGSVVRQPWVIDNCNTGSNYGSIWKYTTGWSQINGIAGSDISCAIDASSGTQVRYVYATDQSGNLYSLNAAGNGWNKVSATGIYVNCVDVDCNGKVFIVSNSGQVYRQPKGSTTWENLPGITAIDVGSDPRMGTYASDGNYVYQWDETNKYWVMLPGHRLLAVDVCPEGVLSIDWTYVAPNGGSKAVIYSPSTGSWTTIYDGTPNGISIMGIGCCSWK
jgi:hypothetical protein